MFTHSTFHYPPDLFNLLCDAIPILVRGKRDVLLFFEGAGVPAELRADLERRVHADKDSVSKRELAKVLLTRINRKDDLHLAVRRELLKRVVEIEDFSSCWPEKQLEAKGLVAQIRHVVNVRDSFTRMDQARAEERRERMRESERLAADRAGKAEERDRIRRDLFALFSMTDAHARGTALEDVLNRLFGIDGMLVREAFVRRDSDGSALEQVDGAVSIDGELYLVEMKWHTAPIGRDPLCSHLVRVFNRGEVRGIVISASGFTGPAVDEARTALVQKVFVLVELREFVEALERSISIVDLIRKKVMIAQTDKNPLHRPIGVTL